MKLTVLGMNGPFPSALGATSGYLLESGDTRVALDMGSGVLGQLTGRMAPESLDGLLLSHWHYDHCSDLLPLIFRLEAMGKTLPVWAPEDKGSPIRRIAGDIGCLDLKTVCPGDTLQVGGLSVTVGEARHPVPAVMYRFTAEGKTLCYTGDTNTVDGLEAFAADADLLLADGLFPDSLWAEGKPHLSASLAASLARDAGAKRLVITHLNPNIPSAPLLEEARKICPKAELAKQGAVYPL